MTSSKLPWKRRREIPDPQVQDTAEQYDNARRLLHQQPPASGVLLPLLNTAAIAVELFLKSLSSHLVHVPVDNFDGLSTVHASPDLKSHKLVDLLDKIPCEVRDQLETSFSSASLTQTVCSLRDVLSQYEWLFETSRYPFEQNANVLRYDLMLLMELCAFLRTFVANLEPSDQIEWS